MSLLPSISDNSFVKLDSAEEDCSPISSFTPLALHNVNLERNITAGTTFSNLSCNRGRTRSSRPRCTSALAFAKGKVCSATSTSELVTESSYAWVGDTDIDALEFEDDSDAADTVVSAPGALDRGEGGGITNSSAAPPCRDN